MRMRVMEPDYVHDTEIPSHLAMYLDQSPIALALADARDDNPLIFINHGFRELTGYTSEDVVGQNCRMLQRDADNEEARERIREFLANDRQSNVRTMLINFRKDGSPFVNLLYMSKLRQLGGKMPYIFASQFDVSRSQPERLAAYDAELGRTLGKLTPILAESGIVLEGSLTAIANTAATIAQAKLTLSDLDRAAFP
ncbi:PAS domain-containing protein [uncultured Sphingomonas sp.]|uniref:PAS domain-containing protein n=1 Tax=uncultured Sphingomonas sp. TaxID=158754 RepID=UPI0025CE1E60|nr:PAS domain-containing protein [uncultured Sphingomonas sp.]